MSVAISIKNLTKTYATGFEALKGISLEVNQGDFFALLGPNGAGKSTTIGILSTLVNEALAVLKYLEEMSIRTSMKPNTT